MILIIYLLLGNIFPYNNMPKVSDSVYVNSKPETKTLKEESGNILYNLKINIYYVTESCLMKIRSSQSFGFQLLSPFN